MGRAELKERAKEKLKGKYGEVIKLLLVYFFIYIVAGIIIVILGLNEDTTDLLSSLAELIIGGFIYFGYMNFFLKISRNEEVTYKELFSKTSLFWHCIILSLLIGIFTLLWSLLFIIPGIIASINYSIAYYVALDNPNLGAREVLKKSKEIMNGHKMDYFILNLSFFGWAILGIFTFGLLYLWLIPYMQVTFANFYNEIKEQN